MPRDAGGQLGIEDRADRWLSSHTLAVAVLVVGLGLVYRLAAATATVMTPEEVRALTASPLSLYSLMLGMLRLVSDADILVRMPSILAGTATLWFAFLWIRSGLDRTTALTVLLLLAFAPASVATSVQAGSAAMLLAELCAALWLLTTAVNRGSPRAGALSGLLLLAAVGTDGSSLFAILGMAAYVIFLLSQHRTLLRPLLPWMVIASIALAGAILAWLTGIYPDARSLVPHMPVAERGVVVLGVTRLLDAFRFCFSSGVGAAIGLAAYLSGVGIMFARGTSVTKDGSRLPGLAVLLLVPLLVVVGAATAGLARLDHPGGAGFLLPFCFAAVGWLVGIVPGTRRTARVLLVLFVLLAVVAATAPGSSSLLKGYGRSTFDKGLDGIRETLSRGGVVYGSRGDRALLERYLCPPGTPLRAVDSDDFDVSACGGYFLAGPVRSGPVVIESLAGDLRRLERELGLERGDRIAVVDLAGELASQLADYKMDLQRFGPVLTMMPVAATGNVLGFLARLAAGHPEAPFRTALWPTDYMDDSARILTREVAGNVLSYEQLYEMVSRDGPRMLYDRLPALCFWIFGDLSERHLNLTRSMDERRSTTSESYSFDLLLTDPDSTAGLFAVTCPAGDALLGLAEAVRTRLTQRIVSVLAPSEFLGNQLRRTLNELGDHVFPYGDVYLGMRGGRGTRFDDFLPALAFWEFGNRQYHPGFVKRMEEGSSYLTDYYRFTLIAVDNDSLVGVYVIEPVENSPRRP